jgi:hypothetical protein
VHPNQITSWKAQLEEGAADVFGPGSGSGAAQPAVDVKSLHAKIGELSLENESLICGFHASWSLPPTCGTCRSAPKICSNARNFCSGGPIACLDAGFVEHAPDR